MKSKLVKFLMFILLLGAISATIYYRDQFTAVALEQLLDEAGMAAPLLFVGLYAIGTTLFLPGSVLTLAGGALFGPVLGTFLNLTGATLGAMLAFLIARYLAANWVESKTGGRMKQLKEGVEKEGWRFVAFTRLVPLFPFNLLNYALGLTRIKLWHYLAATYLFMLPGAIAYTYLGYVGREALTGEGAWIQHGMIALALLAMVAFIPRFIGLIRKSNYIDPASLQELLRSDDKPLLLDVRTYHEFGGEHGTIEGAINIPLDELTDRIHELEAYIEKQIVTICHTDKRSSRAAQRLLKKGFTQVHVAKGGMVAWNESLAEG